MRMRKRRREEGMEGGRGGAERKGKERKGKEGGAEREIGYVGG